MKYYEIHHQEKSSDCPSPIFRDIFCAKDEAEYISIRDSYIEGCEDWNVHEISKERYDREMEVYKEEYIY